jgi:hypothetical protein
MRQLQAGEDINADMYELIDARAAQLRLTLPRLSGEVEASNACGLERRRDV